MGCEFGPARRKVGLRCDVMRRVRDGVPVLFGVYCDTHIMMILTGGISPLTTFTWHSRFIESDTCACLRVEIVVRVG